MGTYARAIYAAIYSFLVTVANAMVDGGFHDVTDAQWLFSVIAGLGAFGAVVGWNTVQERKTSG